MAINWQIGDVIRIKKSCKYKYKHIPYIIEDLYLVVAKRENIADIKNINKKYYGQILAGEFENFEKDYMGSILYGNN